MQGNQTTTILVLPFSQNHQLPIVTLVMANPPNSLNAARRMALLLFAAGSADGPFANGARRALKDPDPWNGFCRFVTILCASSQTTADSTMCSP
jgi:hypothetical protein